MMIMIVTFVQQSGSHQSKFLLSSHLLVQSERKPAKISTPKHSSEQPELSSTSTAKKALSRSPSTRTSAKPSTHPPSPRRRKLPSAKSTRRSTPKESGLRLSSGFSKLSTASTTKPPTRGSTSSGSS